MEHERFFYFGSDPQAAKWYLLTGSSSIPQRMLCLRDYAIAKKILHFGNFIKLDNQKKPIAYCYVIVNIFDIPFQELHNFFIMACENNEDKKRIKKPYDINFKKGFTLGKEKSIPNINIKTTIEEISDNYLSGLENITPTFPYNLNMNVIPCDAPRIPMPTRITTETNEDDDDDKTNNDKSEAMEVDTDTQENIIRTNTGTVKRRIPVKNNRSRNKVEIQSQQIIPPDNNLFRNTGQNQIVPPDNSLFSNSNQNQIVTPDNNLFINPNENYQEISEPLNFPSVVSTPIAPTVSITPTNPVDMEEEILDDILSEEDDVIVTFPYNIKLKYDNNKLKNLANFIQKEPRTDWFNVEYTDKIIISGQTIAFVKKDYNGDFSGINTNELYTLHPEVQKALSNSSNSYLKFETFLNSNREKNHLIYNLTTTTGNSSKFESLLNQTIATEIVKIVDSKNDTEFIRNITESSKPYYILLYGLYKYLKMRNTEFSLFMEIMATIYYGDNKLSIISEFFIKLYFRYKNCKVIPTINSVNLYHFQRINMQNEDIDQVESLLSTFRDNSIFEKINKRIGKYIFNVNGGIIVQDSSFCLNLFTVDQNLQYIFTENNEIYLSTKSLRNVDSSFNIDEVYINRYANNIFNILKNITYKGISSYS